MVRIRGAALPRLALLLAAVRSSTAAWTKLGTGRCLDKNGNEYDEYYDTFYSGGVTGCKKDCESESVCRGIIWNSSPTVTCNLLAEDGKFISKSGYSSNSQTNGPNTGTGYPVRVDGCCSGRKTCYGLAAPQPPTTSPTKYPTTYPTASPSKSPTKFPTAYPTTPPTRSPTETPTTPPPTGAPSTAPTRAPVEPTVSPTMAPHDPTVPPSDAPSSPPSPGPSRGPTVAPTSSPTKKPSFSPTRLPTVEPTRPPNDPTTSPTRSPSPMPTGSPTPSPTTAPTAAPSSDPSVAPTRSPSPMPTGSPTSSPTTAPTAAPSSDPSVSPTRRPTRSPTGAPSRAPSGAPTRPPLQPTAAPTPSPTRSPSSSKPTREPSSEPTASPGAPPTSSPSKDAYVQELLDTIEDQNTRLKGLESSVSNLRGAAGEPEFKENSKQSEERAKDTEMGMGAAVAAGAAARVVASMSTARAAAAGGSAVAGIGGGMVSSSAMLRAARLGVATSLIECPDNSSEGLGFLTSPLGIEIGDSELNAELGCVVGNWILSLCPALVAAGLYFVGKGSLTVAMAGILALVFDTLSIGTAECSSALLSHGSHGQAFLGAMSLFVLYVAGGVTLMVGGQVLRWADPYPAYLTHNAPRGFWWWVTPRFGWEPKEGCELRVEALGHWFDGYRPPLAAQHGITCILGVTAGAASGWADSEIECAVALGLCTSLSFAQFFFSLIRRPHSRPVDNVWDSSGFCIEALSFMFIVLAVRLGSNALTNAATILIQVGLILGIIKMIFDAVLLINGICCVPPEPQKVTELELGLTEAAAERPAEERAETAAQSGDYAELDEDQAPPASPIEHTETPAPQSTSQTCKPRDSLVTASFEGAWFMPSQGGGRGRAQDPPEATWDNSYTEGHSLSKSAVLGPGHTFISAAPQEDPGASYSGHQRSGDTPRRRSGPPRLPGFSMRSMPQSPGASSRQGSVTRHKGHRDRGRRTPPGEGGGASRGRQSPTAKVRSPTTAPPKFSSF